MTWNEPQSCSASESQCSRAACNPNRPNDQTLETHQCCIAPIITCNSIETCTSVSGGGKIHLKFITLTWAFTRHGQLIRCIGLIRHFKCGFFKEAIHDPTGLLHCEEQTLRFLIAVVLSSCVELLAGVTGIHSSTLSVQSDKQTPGFPFKISSTRISLMPHRGMKEH